MESYVSNLIWYDNINTCLTVICRFSYCFIFLSDCTHNGLRYKKGATFRKGDKCNNYCTCTVVGTVECSEDLSCYPGFCSNHSWFCLISFFFFAVFVKCYFYFDSKNISFVNISDYLSLYRFFFFFITFQTIFGYNFALYIYDFYASFLTLCIKRKFGERQIQQFRQKTRHKYSKIWF